MNMSFADVMMQLFRQHLAVLPVLLPSFTAMLMLLIGDRDSLPRLRRIALVSVALGIDTMGVLTRTRSGAVVRVPESAAA